MSAKDGGESALSKSLTETIDSDDCVLDHLHRMCEHEEHRIALFFTNFSKNKKNFLH